MTQFQLYWPFIIYVIFPFATLAFFIFIIVVAWRIMRAQQSIAISLKTISEKLDKTT